VVSGCGQYSAGTADVVRIHGTPGDSHAGAGGAAQRPSLASTAARSPLSSKSGIPARTGRDF